MSFNVGDHVVWNRRRKGGLRRVTPIEVVVAGRRGDGMVVERTRRGRVVSEVVPAKNLERPS